ncbi:MAG TPA: glycosyltransferase family 4 protein [Thermoleophilaceae bacterium]|nr:glycosyltransferase family 4 protein [Thermoleophilaceae bacterium]
MPVRCAVLPPVAVPYREPLFALMGQNPEIALRVVYQSQGQPGWDQPEGWFSSDHPYDAVALGSRQHARPGRTPVVVPRGVGHALSEFDPEVVVSWEYGPTTLRALAWCRRRGRRLVIFSELPPHADTELPGWQLRIHRALAARADGFVVASSAARRRVIALGAAPGAVAVSLQSADLEPFAAVAAGAGSPPVRLLYVGRLVEDKNLERLLRALAGLDACLELCGTGPLEGELRSLAERLGVEADFRGYVAPAELPARFTKAGALVLPSLYDPFGVAVREAAAAGLPVICSRNAGAAGDFAVDGRNAVLVDPLSESSIRAALELVVGDAGARRRMAAESRALSAEHPLADDAAAFVGAITRAAAAAPRRVAG